jgi:hypothetical protein
MKTDRRHNLQTNWLADHLGRWLEKVKPYTNHIIAGAFVLAAIGVVWLLVARFWGGDQESAWQELDARMSPAALRTLAVEATETISRQIERKQKEIDDLRLQRPLGDDKQAKDAFDKRMQALEEELKALNKERQDKWTETLDRQHEELGRIAKENIGTPAGQAAAFATASTDLAQAADTLLTDSVGAREKLGRAIEFFDLVRKHADDDLLRQRAQFQLARAYETRLERDPQHEENDDLAKAAAEYESLVKQNSYCKEEAQQRLAELNASKSLFRLLSQRIDEEEEGPPKSKEPAKAKGGK